MALNRSLKLAIATGSIAVLAGCGAMDAEDTGDSPVASATQTSAAAETTGYQNDASRNVQVLMQADALKQPAQSVIHFEFDQAIVPRESLNALRAHAEYMQKKELREVRLAGHADERGTREYNMALGEARAKAVRDFLVAYGVNQDLLVTVSYGEEKPVVTGSGEQSWAQNRRVEVLYR